MFPLRLRKNEQTRCSVEKAIAAEGKRWVGVLIEEAWRLFLLMRHRAVPYQGKPKSVVAIEESFAQRRILARSGLARYSAPSVKENAAVRLQTTWNKIHQQWVVLWIDNWYNKQFTTNPDKNDKSLSATALADLLLRDAPRVCSDMLCARARAMHSSSMTFLLSPCAAHFSLFFFSLRCCVGVCARPRAKKGAKKCFLWCCVQHGFQKLVLERIKRVPDKNFFFGVPRRGTFRQILTMQLEQPKMVVKHHMCNVRTTRTCRTT